MRNHSLKRLVIGGGLSAAAVTGTVVLTAPPASAANSVCAYYASMMRTATQANSDALDDGDTQSALAWKAVYETFAQAYDADC